MRKLKLKELNELSQVLLSGRVVFSSWAPGSYVLYQGLQTSANLI